MHPFVSHAPCAPLRLPFTLCTPSSPCVPCILPGCTLRLPRGVLQAEAQSAEQEAQAALDKVEEAQEALAAAEEVAEQRQAEVQECTDRLEEMVGA